jgi:hypothetical protein
VLCTDDRRLVDYGFDRWMEPRPLRFMAKKMESVKPEWLRLPAPRERCPYTGLSRSTLNELTIPGPANGAVPPVKSVVLRKRGASRGIRLINYDSLMAYLAGLNGPATNPYW